MKIQEARRTGNSGQIIADQIGVEIEAGSKPHIAVYASLEFPDATFKAVRGPITEFLCSGDVKDGEDLAALIELVSARMYETGVKLGFTVCPAGGGDIGPLLNIFATAALLRVVEKVAEQDTMHLLAQLKETGKVKLREAADG